jgi:hypothetical protein
MTSALRPKFDTAIFDLLDLNVYMFAVISALAGIAIFYAKIFENDDREMRRIGTRGQTLYVS